MQYSNDEITRGVLAEKSGVNIETIRYYEKIALMPNPLRSDGGHRIYNKVHLKRLQFIRRCRELGFTLQDIRELLNIVDDKTYTCDDVKNRTIAHLNDIKQKIRDLKKIEKTLKSFVSECDGGLKPKCPIIDTLFA
tara:strand:+ start:346 stop:753 length:408 start_codon:yes stop_codon:yes gene_type:complete